MAETSIPNDNSLHTWQTDDRQIMLSDALVVVAVYIAIDAVWRLTLGGPNTSTLNPVLFDVLHILRLLVIPLGWLAIRGRLDLRELGWFHGPIARNILYGAVWSAVGGAIVFAFQFYFGPRLYVSAQPALPPGAADRLRDPFFFTWTLATMVIAAPLAEEIFFRATLFRGLRSRLTVLPALLAQATLFGVYHNYALPGQVLTGILGVIMAYVYHRTGSIWSCIGCHVVLNGVGFGMMVVGVFLAPPS